MYLFSLSSITTRTSIKSITQAIFASSACAASMMAHADTTLQTLPHQMNTQAFRYSTWDVPVGACIQGFNAAAWTNAMPPHLSKRPAIGGKTWNYSDVARWRANIAGSRFVTAGDFATGSPADWSRIKTRATTFQNESEPPILTRSTKGEITNGATIGGLARDAAIVALIESSDPNGAPLSSVAEWLTRFVSNPENDFSSSCYRVRNQDTSEGKYSTTALDGLFSEGMVLARIALIYDLVADQMEAPRREEAEAWLRKMAWFHAVHQDQGLEAAFPERNVGNYTKRAGNAAYQQPFVYLDSTACKSTSDKPECYVYTHVLQDGTPKNKISHNSMNFNNRRAAAFMGIQTVGVVLGEQELIDRAKRYHMEWLTFGVFPDGSQSEYSRNGDYQIPNQGLLYAQSNIQSAMYLATWLARSGDFDLTTYKTTAGLFGTESVTGAYKSMEMVAQTVFDLRNGTKQWFQAEKGLSPQNPRKETDLGEVVTRYLGGAPRDTYHELGMLAVAGSVPSVKVACNVLRNPQCTNLRFPGSPHPTYGTLPVDTGAGQWSDVMNFVPSALLFR